MVGAVIRPVTSALMLEPALQDVGFEPPIPLIGRYRTNWWHEPCVYCGERRPKAQMSKEHIVPRSADGDKSWENMATACHECNHKRGAMPLLMMLLWRSYESRGVRLTKKQRAVMGIKQPLLHELRNADLTKELASVMMGA